MKLVDPIKFTWKWLQNTFNALVTGINERTIIPAVGGGIDSQETENGTLIALSSSGVLSGTASAAVNKPPSGTAGWQSVNVLDPVTGNIMTMWAWGTTPVAATLPVWTDVDVMDSSCVRSTIHVLTRP
jgi:hypothetical protein